MASLSLEQAATAGRSQGPRATVAAVLPLLREAIETLAPLAASSATDALAQGPAGVSDAQVLHHAEPALRQLEMAAQRLRALYTSAAGGRPPGA